MNQNEHFLVCNFAAKLVECLLQKDYQGLEVSVKIENEAILLVMVHSKDFYFKEAISIRDIVGGVYSFVEMPLLANNVLSAFDSIKRRSAKTVTQDICDDPR